MSPPRVTDRDRRLICLLSTARYLSTSQVVRLVFSGLSDSVFSGRLNRLAATATRATRSSAGSRTGPTTASSSSSGP